MKKEIETTYDNNIKLLFKRIKEADAIVIGAGSGLSTSAGYTYSGERFERYFSDFINKYHFLDMYSAGFYPYETIEEYWAYWSRYIYYNRYVNPSRMTYKNLLECIANKDYFVITTNVDHQFQLAGIDKQKLFYTQGDYGLFQCSKKCHDKTYDNEDIIKEMVNKQKDMKIPSELVPHCPVCGAYMNVNLRSDDTFVEDEGWRNAQERYLEFLSKYKNKKIVFLELGVGYNTPVIIKYPFWKMCANNNKATYVCINQEQAICPKEIEKQSLLFEKDINLVLEDLIRMEDSNEC